MILPQVEITPAINHNIKAIPTLPEFFKTELGELNIPAPSLF